MPTLLVRNIAHLATFDDEARELRDGALFVRDNVVVAVGTTAELADRQADQVLDLSGHRHAGHGQHPPPHLPESHTGHGAGQRDPIAALVMCGPFKVDYSFISGREIIVEGHFRHLDVDGLFAKHQTVMDRIYDQ